jgi:REP element-mobilizing transposase RayT
VELSKQQRDLLSVGIARGAEVTGRQVWACAILRSHVHLLLSRTDDIIERMVCESKRRASWELTRSGVHPLAEHRMPNGRLHSPWARGFWKVYLNSADEVDRVMRYVNENPEGENLPRQAWDFVTKPDL